MATIYPDFYPDFLRKLAKKVGESRDLASIYPNFYPDFSRKLAKKVGISQDKNPDFEEVRAPQSQCKIEIGEASPILLAHSWFRVLLLASISILATSYFKNLKLSLHLILVAFMAPVGFTIS